MSNMSEWLERKYSNLDAQTANQRLLAQSQARATDVSSSLAPGEAAARNAAAMGQAAASRASAGVMDANRAWVAPLAGSEIGARGASADLSAAQAAGVRAEQQPIPGFDPSSVLPHFSMGTPDVGNYKRGATRIPGKGDGRTDTQPAVLAPGEAVLNKAAAEHLGRDTIELLNALGQHKMDLDAATASQQQASDQQAAPAPAPGYAGGTAEVPRAFGMAPGPGTQNTWTPDIGTGGGTMLRKQLNLGAPRVVDGLNTSSAAAVKPLPVIPGYADGTADVASREQGAYDEGYLRDYMRSGGQGQPDSNNKAALDKATKLKAPGYAKGTAKVPAKGKGKGAPPQEAQPMPQPGPAVGGDGGRGGLNAHVLAALAQMGGGGGGMPAPNAAPPMPMPMPQVGARRAAA